MAPYSKKVKVVFDGKTFVPDEPLDLPTGGEFEVDVPTGHRDIERQIDPRTIEERVEAFRTFVPMNTGVILPNEAFRRDENMYPDRW